MKKVWIFDLDGTLADCQHRISFMDIKPKNWEAANNLIPRDTPIVPVVEVLRALQSSGQRIGFVSGRSEELETRKMTAEWIFEHVTTECEFLLMRKAGDYRPDNIVKSEILDEIIKEGYTVVGVFDDRKMVTNMWRDRGIFVFDVLQENRQGV